MTRIDAARGPLHEIAAGEYRARICEVGATLDSLERAGRPVILSSPPDEPMLLYRGAIVAPWPNRIGDGLYTFDGQEVQAPINEVDRMCALHGLVSFQRFTPVGEPAADSVTLRCELVPSLGYPFHLGLEVTYALHAEAGLTTTVRARNLGPRDLPYGVCPHPYLVAGPEPLDTWSLQVTAGTYLQVTEDRLLPTGMAAIEPGSDLDFSAGRVIGTATIDNAMTDLERTDSVATVRVSAPGGTGVQISFDERCPWVQFHTGDRPEPELDRKGLAVEPMTCPPDAFRSGTDVVRLGPGQEHEAAWTISAW